MRELEAWLSEIAARVAALGSDCRVVGMEGGTDAALPDRTARAGFPGVLALWGDRDRRSVGLLARPGVSPHRWPVVMLQRGQALTLASDGRTLLPQLIVRRVLSNAPDASVRLADRWDAVRERAAALHRSLGGDPDSLERVVSRALDPAARRRFLYVAGAEADFEAAHSEACRAVDTSAAFVQYADWLDAAIARRARAPEDPAVYGPWGRRVLCVAQRLKFSSRPDLPLPREWLDRVIEDDAGVDSGVPAEPSWAAAAGAASGESALIEAAMLRSRMPGGPPGAEAVADGLAAALVAMGSSYAGLTHLEATIALDEGGQPERAWTAVQSAAWWSARATGATPDAILDSCLFLAERRGWDDLAWLLERGGARRRPST